MDEQRTWIIAGNVQQATDWAHSSGMSIGKCFWVASASDLRGVRFDTEDVSLVWTGTYRDRPDFRDLITEVHMRGGPPPPPPEANPILEEYRRLAMPLKPDPVLSPEALKALFDGEPVRTEGVVGPPGEPIPVPIPYQQIATCIAETVLDPDERTALVERLIEVFVAHDPMFQKRRFRGAADG